MLAACGSDDLAGQQPGQGSAGVIDVVASFYPLQYVTERLGGSLVRVTNPTPIGAEPHDLELTARDVGQLRQADLVVYLSGFSPSVDDAVATAAKDRSLEVGPYARLDLTLSPDEEASGDEPTRDPHFWLDPTRLADVAVVVAERLSAARPDAAATFAANLAILSADLATLDASYQAGLKNCRSRDLVTSHTAFGYLADRYALNQVGIAGLNPAEEPTPADLAVITEFVRANNVLTIYSESLVSPAIAHTIAAETGATTAVLDPLEGRSGPTGGDYLAVMRVNLATLRQGQVCT